MTIDDPARPLPPGAGSEPGEPHDEADASSLDPVIQAHIGRELKSLFNDIALEPVPDRFLELLRRLDDKTEGRS